MSTVCITVDGVLRKPIGLAPIDIGIALYRGLATSCRLVLFSDERHDDEVLSNWLSLEGLREHVQVQYSDPVLDQDDIRTRRLTQAARTQCQYPDLDLVIDPDPIVTAHLVSFGFNTMTYTHSAYADPRWRPDYVEVVQPWDELAAQVAKNAELMAADERTKREDQL